MNTRSAATTTALLLTLFALGPSGCGGSSPGPETAASTAGEAPPATTTPRMTSVTFSGRIRLEPSEAFAAPRGAIYHHVFFLDGEIFDAMTCYVSHDHCAVFDLQQTDVPGQWVAHAARSQGTRTPITLHFDFRRAAGWTDARRVRMTVTTPEHGEAGVAVLRRDESVAPPTGLRSRRRAHSRLRTAFERMEVAYHESPHAERTLPPSRAETQSAPPCEPSVVEDQATVEWLDLTAPVVLNWAYSVESDEEAGTLRLMARRDTGCDGAYEAVMLEAVRDEYGDLTLLRP